MKIRLLLLFLLLCSSFSLASLQAEVDELSVEVEGQVLEGPLATLFGNQRVNIHITLDNGEQMILGLVTKKNVVQSLQAQAVEKPTLKIFATEAAVARIQSSDDPGTELLTAFDNEEVTYQAIGFFNKIKFATISVFVNIIRTFTEEKPEVVIAEEVDDSDEPEEELTDEPEEPEIIEEPTTEEPEVEDTPDSEPVEEGPQQHEVKMVNDGFSETSITVKVGDTVVWKNTRSGTLKTAMIIGTQECRNARSEIFSSGESYSYTFEEEMSCTIVDGIMTTQSMKVVVG